MELQEVEIGFGVPGCYMIFQVILMQENTKETGSLSCNSLVVCRVWHMVAEIDSGTKYFTNYKSAQSRVLHPAHDEKRKNALHYHSYAIKSTQNGACQCFGIGVATISSVIPRI